MSWADRRAGRVTGRATGRRPWRRLVAAAAPVALVVGLAGITATPADAATTMPVQGHGFGHGRGMSQWGAYGAAVRGLTYAQIVAFYYPGTTLASQSDPSMRVLISADNDGTTQVNPVSGLAICHGNGVRTAASTSASITGWRLRLVSGVLTLEYRTSSGWHVSPTKVDGASATFTRSTSCTAYGPLAVPLVLPSGSVEGIRGGARAAVSSSSLRTVGVMSMTDYLAGVVASEMPSGWATEALRAQSVAARTYAERYRLSIGSTTPWDICDTTSCQVFKGTNGEAASTTAAVTATAGRVVTYQGSPAFTEFSASNGGYTVAGSSGTPYLTAKADPYDGVVAAYGSWHNPHSWSDTVSFTSLHNHYPSVGTVTSVRVLARDGHGDFGGRTTSVRIYGTAGSVTVSGSSFASAAGLLSIWWTSGDTVAHDLTGDYHPDLLVRVAATGVMRIYPSDGSGGWGASSDHGSGWGGMGPILLPGDVSGDRFPDIVARSKTSGALMLYPGDGRGWVRSGVQIGSGFQDYPTIAAVGDLSGDGNPDLLAVQASTGTLYMYRTDGHGHFLPGNVKFGPGWGGMDALVGVGDVDGDGYPDLLARVHATGALVLYRGTAAHWLSAGLPLTGDFSRYQLLASPGDLDGDGTVDLLTVDPTSGQLTRFDLTATSATAQISAARAAGGPGWLIFDSMS